jgi:hypothetical protein
MCQKVIDYYDTANNPVYKIKCNCGTTVCQNINTETNDDVFNKDRCKLCGKLKNYVVSGRILVC